MITKNVYRKNKGWENSYVSDGETIGLEYSDSILEGIKIRIVPKKNKGAGVAYSGYLEKMQHINLRLNK